MPLNFCIFFRLLTASTICWFAVTIVCFEVFIGHQSNINELVQDNDVPFWTALFSPLFTARGPNEQVKVSAGLRAVQNEQPNERQCSVQPPFRGVNTERAERTRDNIGRIRVGRPRVRGRGLWILAITSQHTDLDMTPVTVAQHGGYWGHFSVSARYFLPLHQSVSSLRQFCYLPLMESLF